MADYFDDWLKNSEESLAPDLRPHREAIARIESGGDYHTLGPVTKKGDRALGKYQVMASNLPEWTKAALGRELSPKEFLASPEAQDKVFDHRFGQYLREHGPADAASIWFTGKPLAEGAGRRDQLGTTGQGYVDQYLKNLGGMEGSVSVAPQDDLEKLNADFDKYVAKEYGAPAPTSPIAPINWGPLQNMIDAALFGRGAKIAPTAQTQQNVWENIAGGMTPEQAITAARSAKPGLVAEQEAAREAWQKENPGTALVTQIGGEALPMLAGIGTANAALRGAGALAPRLAPAMEFLTGAGRGGALAQGAGDLATGAWQGALGNAIVGQDPTQGALWGGALGVPAGWLSRILLAPERATMRPEVAKAAEKYVNAGGKLIGAPLIEGPNASRVASLAGKGEPELVENFNAMLANRVGAAPEMAAEGVKGLTPKVMSRNWARLHNEFNAFAGQHGINIDKPLIQDFKDILTDARKDLGKYQKTALADVEEVIGEIVKGIKGSATMPGRDFLSLTNRGSMIDALFKHKAATPFAERLKDSLYGALERTNPDSATKIRELRQQWRDMNKLEKAKSDNVTGLIDAKKLAAKYGGDEDAFGEIARMGEYLPSLTAAGAVKGHSPGPLAEIARSIPGRIGQVALGAGAGYGLAQQGLGWLSPALTSPSTAAGAAALAALGFAGKKALAKRYGSDAYVQKLIENTLRPRGLPSFVNPALPFIPMLSQRNQ